MPRKVWTGAARPPGMKGKALTPEMARALRALKAGGMEAFRVGYAHTVQGPFFHKGTIESLWKRGLVDYSAVIKRAWATQEGLKWLADNVQSSSEAA